MPASLAPHSLYRLHELAFRTQYAELKERTRAAGNLLAGTPGTLYKRNGTGRGYWYRVYYATPGKQVDDLVGSASDEAALSSMRGEIDFAQWVSKQVSDLRKLEFQTADKGVARVLVELHNRGAFEAGLTVVGTLGYMAWLNELGVKAVALRTQDLDLGRGRRLKFAAPLPFLQTIQATQLPFFAVPGLPSQLPSTSVKLPGRDGLRVDVLAPGWVLGTPVHVPELEWYAQAVPHYDYLLEAPQWACIALHPRVPASARAICLAQAVFECFARGLPGKGRQGSAASCDAGGRLDRIKRRGARRFTSRRTGCGAVGCAQAPAGDKTSAGVAPAGARTVRTQPGLARPASPPYGAAFLVEPAS